MNPEEEALAPITSPERLQQLAQKSLTLACLVASNYAAPPELLAQLSERKDQEINKALVSNPNTPTKILMSLGVTYPAQLLANPVFSLFLLENPSFYREMPLDTLLSLLSLEAFARTWGVHILKVRSETEIIVTFLGNYLSIWNQWRENNSDIGIFLINSNLSKFNLKKCDLRRIVFFQLNLESAKLQNAKLENSCFGYCNFFNANLAKSNLQNTRLLNCNLRNANLAGANLHQADLIRTNLKGTKINSETKIAKKWILVWEIVNSGYLDQDLRGADLSGANLQQVNFKGANLENANLQEADLTEANLEGANLTKANLTKANLTSTNLERANLQEADLTESDLKSTNLKLSNLDKTIMEGVKMQFVYVDAIDFLDKAIFKNYPYLSLVIQNGSTSMYIG